MNNNTTTFKILLHQGAESGALAHIHIHVDELDIDDFEFILIFNSCETQEGIYEIEGEETWSYPYKAQVQDVHILDNGELTVSGIVFLSPDVDIIVEPGGKLILDGGLLTASCNDLWNGIDLWGDWRMPQLEEYQGAIRIYNGGTIEFARCGVENTIFENSVNTCTGGFIFADSAVFKDNLIGVRFWPYYNYNPGNGQPMYNFSRLINSEFVTTRELYDMGFDPQEFVYMQEVQGIYIKGCNFHNELTQDELEQGDLSGQGLLAFESDFVITDLCIDPTTIPCPEYKPCRFENLEYGIWAGYITSTESARIRNSEFINNRTGIDLCASSHPEVTQNTFYVRKAEEIPPFDDAVYCGLYLDNCTGYQVEENFFYTFLDEQQRGDLVSVGLVVNNSGPVNNEIYNNTFDGLYTGLIAQEINRNADGMQGLQIKCNVFNNDIFDVAMTQSSPGIKGIAKDQGSDANAPTGPANNLFTYIDPEQDPEPEGNYYNVCENITYWHHANTTGFNVIPTRHTPEPVVEPKPGGYSGSYDASESCPSHLFGGGPGVEEERTTMLVSGQQADSVQNLLELLIDGGNTEELLTEIQTSFPEDGYELYSELISESPYLSDTSMIEAIEKEDVLLPGMITDVLIANPQSAKSEEVMTAVDERDNPLTDDQLADIGEGRFIIGAKEALESDYAYYQYKKDLFKNNLLRLYKADTLIASRSDSIIDILSFQPNLSHEYFKAFEYFKMGDSVNVVNTLAAIPGNYELNSTELFEHSLYEDYFELLLLKDTAGSIVFEMDSIQKATLYNIMSNSTGILKALARNILIVNDSLDYAEPIFLPQPGLKSGKVRYWPVKKNIAENILKIYPNPAKNVVIIETKLKEEPRDAVINLIDTKGIIVKTYPIFKQNSYLVVPLSDFQPGMLFCQLIIRNKIIGSGKIVILK